MIRKFFREEIRGYQFIKDDLNTKEGLINRRTVILVFTFFYVAIIAELMGRCVRLYTRWIPDVEPEDLSFSSYAYNETKRIRYQGRQDVAHWVLIQAGIALVVMVPNNIIWATRIRSFSQVSHTLHYFIAAICVAAMVPLPEHPIASDVKYCMFNLSCLIMQVVLA